MLSTALLAADAHAQSCNSNNEKSSDACTESDVQQRQSTLAALRANAFAQGDANLNQSVANAEQSLERSLAQCSNSSFEAGCKSEALDYAIFQLEAWLRASRQNSKTAEVDGGTQDSSDYDQGSSEPKESENSSDYENQNERSEVVEPEDSQNGIAEFENNDIETSEKSSETFSGKSILEAFIKLIGLISILIFPIWGFFNYNRRKNFEEE